MWSTGLCCYELFLQNYSWKYLKLPGSCFPHNLDVLGILLLKQEWLRTVTCESGKIKMELVVNNKYGFVFIH